MFGKKPHLNPLESRKQLLIAESELNRAQLIQEWVAMTAGVRTLTDRVKTYGSLASSVALLVAGLTAFRRGKSGDAGGKPSRWRTLLKGAGLVSTLWFAFRAKGHGQKNKEPNSRV
jgi:hypothetical protein